jgi:hypothetical protein
MLTPGLLGIGWKGTAVGNKLESLNERAWNMCTPSFRFLKALLGVLKDRL